MRVSFLIVIGMCIALSTLSFIVFTLPSGELDARALHFFGARLDNPLGFVTTHFLYVNSFEYVGAMILLFFLFLCAAVFEVENPYLKSLNSFVLGFIPVVVLTIIEAYSAKALSLDFAYTGMSILGFYLCGFFLVAVWKVLQFENKGLEDGIRSVIRLANSIALDAGDRLSVVYFFLAIAAWLLVLTYAPITFSQSKFNSTVFDLFFSILCLVCGGAVAFVKRIHSEDWMM